MSRPCSPRLPAIALPEEHAQAPCRRKRWCARFRCPEVNPAIAASHSGSRVSALIARARQRAFRVNPADREPVVLGHSRIYILPTRRGWAMIVTVATMLIASLNFALSLGVGVAFLLAGLLAASLLHTFRNLAGIEVTPLSAGETFAGGHVAFTLSLHGGALARSAVTLAAAGARASGDVPAGAGPAGPPPSGAPARGALPFGGGPVSSAFPPGRL